MTKQITITEQDLILAQKAIKEGGTYVHCCLVFQALKREGLNVQAVFCYDFKLEGHEKSDDFIKLPTEAIPITRSKDSLWPTLVGRTFSIELP